ncbi:MAG: uroporphyrinogen decarboxylase family protein [Clostridiales bacterium]
MKNAQQACGFNGGPSLTYDRIVALGGVPDRLDKDPEMIAALAKAAAKAKGCNFVVLPFGSTAEAKALGAEILPWDEQSGPRPGKYTLFDLRELKEADIAAAPQVKAMLEACRLLKRQGIRVAYEISGPLSILSCLMDLTILFKQWRKDGELMQGVFALFQGMLSDYLKEICDAGADVISYADPAGNPAILGPRFSHWLNDWFLRAFLMQALTICCDRNKSLVLCPMLAAGLKEEGLPAREGNRIRACCIGNVKEVRLTDAEGKRTADPYP